jgi:hypothetical protein
VGGLPRDAELGEVDGADADPLGGVDAELHGKRHEPELAVALNRLEVVDDGDAEPGPRVENRKDRNRRVERVDVEEALPAPPDSSHGCQHTAQRGAARRRARRVGPPPGARWWLDTIFRYLPPTD